MIIIGVTGNLASGKSEVAGILKRKGAKVFDADHAAKLGVGIGMPAYKAIVKIFGNGYLNKDRTLDRKKLAAHVFSHPADLKKLNTLIHPGVIFECFKMIEQTKKKKGILALDVPLLYESKMETLADVTVVINSSLKNILKRTKRNGLPESLVRKIISTQWPIERKARRADFVIENNGTLKELEKKVLEVVKKIKSENQR